MTIASTPVFTVVQPSAVLADPHILSDIRDRRSIIDSIYDSLVRRDDHGQFIPWLATHWRVENKGLRWCFTLRTDVIFHNGSALTAQDAAGSLRRALSADMPGELGTEGVLRGYLEGAKIAATDDSVLIVETLSPFGDLLDLLVDIPVVETSSLPKLIGSGPYRASSQQPGKVVLHAFNPHWAAPPPAQSLVWLAEPDAKRRLALLQQGKVDLAVDTPAHYVTGSHDNFQILKRKSTLCVIFLFNLFSGPLQDVRIRKALNYAINLTDIINDPAIAAGQAAPLAGPLSPRHAGTPADLCAYAYNQQKARELLAEAGYAQGLTLEFSLPATFPDESIPLAERIAQQLRDVGITANLTVYHDRPAYAHRVRDKQFGDVACFDSSPASAWRVYIEKLDSRRQGPWWQGYHSETLNALLNEIAATQHAEQRQALLAQAFTLVHHDAPWLFLYAPDNHWTLGEKAKGWQPTFEGRVRIIANPDGGTH
ncbi:MAG: ABC transporter substrate-binding protein [Rouxiella badensis]|uniref:ABC transporter substrate-binding protein n=1 Tax=Rouxiella badensis TaxID=1646377 RepID=UPI003C50107D